MMRIFSIACNRIFSPLFDNEKRRANDSDDHDNEVGYVEAKFDGNGIFNNIKWY